MSSISTLPCTRIHWSWLPTAPCTLPPWKGSLIRGSLGWALAHIAQAAPAPAWHDLRTHSFAEAVFDPQLAWGNQQATSTWSMDCSDTRTQFSPHDAPLSGTMTLFGHWESWGIAILEDCFHHLAAAGLGAKRSSGRITHWDIDESPIYQPDPAGISAVTLHCTSPCRLNNNHSKTPSLDALPLAQGLLRRWRRLHSQTLGSDPYSEEQGRALYASAADLDSVTHNSHSSSIERHSQRQAKRHPMPIIHGNVTITGSSLQQWIPLLALSPQLHIGKQAHFGFGSVTVEWLPSINTHTPHAHIMSEQHQQSPIPMTSTRINP